MAEIKIFEKSHPFLPVSPTLCCNFYSAQKILDKYYTVAIIYFRVKAKPVAKQGRKTVGLLETAGLPLLG
jgi:hypothetical protein